jgi:hypothetical protein
MWARNNSQADELFLTPPMKTGFRVFSERSIIGEWKDGTQLYFSAEFAESWKKRMIALEVEEFKGKGYAYLLSNKLDKLRESYSFDYIVVPKELNVKIGETVYSNSTYEIVKY